MSEPSTHALPIGDLPLADEVRQLLARAYQQAQELGHWHVCAEHIVLALAAATEDAALLGRLGVDRGRLREELAETVLPGGGGPPPPPPPGWQQPINVYSERTRMAFYLAAQSARGFDDDRVRLEHLLLGMLRERGSEGAQALMRCGATEARALALARASGGDGRAAPAPP